MDWKKELTQNNKLYLPLLSEDKITIAPSLLYIEPHPNFLNIWHNGPKTNSDKSLLEAIVILGKTLSEFITKGQGKVQIKTKTSSEDFVTEVDSGLEMLLRRWIKKFLPTHKLFGEEGKKDKLSPEDFVWYIDPIDGTTNYTQNKSDVGLNICCFKKGKPYISYVGKPFYKEQFYSLASEKIVFKEKDNHITILKPSDLPKSLVIGAEFKSSKKSEQNHLKNILDKLNAKPHSLKTIALNLLDLLEGKTNGFYRITVKIWDIAAPAALIKTLYPDSFNFELSFKINNKLTTIPFFSNHTAYYEKINDPHNTTHQMGLFILYPKSQPKIKKIIYNEYFK